MTFEEKLQKCVQTYTALSSQDGNIQKNIETLFKNSLQAHTFTFRDSGLFTCIFPAPGLGLRAGVEVNLSKSYLSYRSVEGEEKFTFSQNGFIVLYLEHLGNSFLRPLKRLALEQV